MWPYTSKKTFFSSASNNGGLPRSHIPNWTGSFDNEYYKQVTMSVSVGLKGFPANKIAPDGRIVRQYGISTHDVTDQYFGRNGSGTRRKVFSVPSKQHHIRNVSQLKVVLNMPQEKRRESLTQLAGAIAKNEVIPPARQLESDEFLQEHLKKSAMNICNVTTRLPPLRRNSVYKAKKIELMALSNIKQKECARPVVKLDDYIDDDDDDDENGLFYARQDRRQSSEHFDLPSWDLESPAFGRQSGFYRLEKGLGKQRRIGEGPRRYGDEDNVRSQRRDSVRMITESIRDQFKAAVREKLVHQDQTVSSEESRKTDPELTIKASIAKDSIVKPVLTEPVAAHAKSGYKLRHEYGKNIEKNWFKNEYLKKQTRESNLVQNNDSTGFGLRLDIFYSPEPQSDDELEEFGKEDDASVVNDEASMQCCGYSTATAEARSRHHRPSLKSLRQSISLDTHTEIDEATEEDSSASDIEIVLKDNRLIQRKTKHKLRKKRRRQLERYRAFLPPDMESLREQQETDEVLPLTDQEIRALRLNIRNKNKHRKLKGKRRFLQVANTIFAFVQFRDILRKVRKRKRQLIKKRQQRIAQLVAKRLEKKINDGEDDLEAEKNAKPTLKDQFMEEIGQKLIFDVESLNIPDNDDSEDSVDENESTSGDEQRKTCNRQNSKSLNSKQSSVKPSKFEVEVKKISLTDLDSVNKKQVRKRKKRTRKRRHSIPKVGRPLEFVIEMPEKSRQRRSRSGSKATQVKQKEISRPPSPTVVKCSCYRGRHAETTARTTTQPRKCPHGPPEPRKRKVKTIKIETGGLMRTYSLENLAKKKPIELRDLIADIDIPAKEIKLQILARKFRRQRRRREQIRLSPCRLPERPTIQQDGSEVATDSGESESSDESDYDFVYGGPFVGTGVMWNKNSKDAKKPTWTEEDLNREVNRITRLFHEMKECTYLRLDGFNDAVLQKLRDMSLLK